MMGWLGNVFICGGLWGIGNKWRPAFLLSIAGELCWMLASYQLAQWDLFFICGVFAALAARSYVRWA